MMFTDVALLFLYLGHQARIPALWTKAAAGGAVLWLSLIVISLLVMLTRTLFSSRELVSLSDKSQKVLGKPLLFPVKFRHIRRRPVKDIFDNQFLVVGVPVGLRCRIGNLLAIDDNSLDVSPPPGGYTGFSWNRIFSPWSCWFTMDSARFLHRGDHGVDLREKLDNFLISQNEDPAQWPHAYLMGVPKFLGWARSVVTWWYLYTEDRELDALIVEINNSYWEKRNVLLRVRPNSDKPTQYKSPETSQYLDRQQLVESLPPGTKAKFYGGDWRKYVFASPFEKVSGMVSQRMMDPLRPESWAADATFSNMTTLEDTGEVKMATRLRCDGPPIDPTQMSSLDVLKFVLGWTLPGMFTTPEIMYKALKVKFSGKMIMNSKPPVRSGSVGRFITRLELDLEPLFRTYLARCVENYPEPVELTYLPCRSFANNIIHMRSPSYYKNEPTSVRYLTVEPTDPGFYTRILNYVDVKTAFFQETQPTGHPADPTAQRLIVSDVTLLTTILEYNSSSSQKSEVNVPSNWKLRQMLTRTRPNSTLSFMDNFVLSSPDAVSSEVYMSSNLRLLMARKLAFSSQKLLGIYIFVASCLIRWLALEGLSLGRNSILSFTSLNVYTGWANLAFTVLDYFLVLGCLTTIKNWVLR